MLTPAWTPLRPHPIQSALWRCKKRFAAVLAGRGSGKTELARRRVVRYLNIAKPWPDPMYFYALPTYKQAKRVAWRQIKRLVPPEYIKGKPNETDMMIETVFGSSLWVVGMDKPQRIEGNQWDGGIVDESCDQRPGSFDLSIVPALSHKMGWCWRIGVSKRSGIGAHDFKNFCMRGAGGDDQDVGFFSWKSEDILTPKQIRWAKESLSVEDYLEQYEASWQSSSGLIYSSFDEHFNVMKWSYQRDRPIYVGSDFNVNPMCWALAQEDDDKRLRIFDEVFLRNTNTQGALDNIAKKYGQHLGGWTFYGDASARARKTAAAHSDYVQIKNDGRFVGKKVLYSRANPPVVDRWATTNALLCNALGQRRLLVDPLCVHLIEDYKNRAYKAGAREANDAGDVGHMADGADYMIFDRYPLRVNKAGQGEVVLGYDRD